MLGRPGRDQLAVEVEAGLGEGAVHGLGEHGGVGERAHGEAGRGRPGLLAKRQRERERERDVSCLCVLVGFGHITENACGGVKKLIRLERVGGHGSREVLEDLRRF